MKCIKIRYSKHERSNYDYMRRLKRQTYIDNLKVAIDTLSGCCDELDKDRLNQNVRVKKYYHTDEHYHLKINPNMCDDGAERMIRSFTEFENVLFETLDDINAVNFTVKRADLTFDTMNQDDYLLYQKLTKLIICCIADSENVKNCYHTHNLWSNRSVSVAIKSDTIEIENYDKAAASDGIDESTNRLEIRSKRMRYSLQEEFCRRWIERLDRALEHFESVQTRYNKELAQQWLEDRAKPEKQRDFTNLTAFLLVNKDCLFTKKQLEDLLERIGNTNPRVTAKNFKDRHNIEFFSLSDLTEVVNAIKKKIITYFAE